MKKTITVKTSFVGFHKWDNAPDRVAFLKDLHRHIFNVEVEFKVNHNDRDLEFFLMKELVQKIIKSLYKKNPDYIDWLMVWSCEMIAEDIYEQIPTVYEVVRVNVSEDWENSSTLYI